MNAELEKLKQKLLPILRKHNVTKAGIFGSYARGEQKKRSDVDLVVEINDERGLLEFIGLKNIIEKALQKKVDLVEYSCIRAEIKDQVLKEEVPILR